MPLPEVIVSWLQNDYGQLGRAAESIAHAMVDDGLASKVVYCEPGPSSDGPATLNCIEDRGLHVYQHQGHGVSPDEYGRVVVDNAGLSDPILLNCGVGDLNWWYHHALAPVARSTTLVTHDMLHLWPGIAAGSATRLARMRTHLIRSSDHVVGLSTGSIPDVTGAVYVGHGCDPAWLDGDVDAEPEPADLAAIAHPRALYFGSLSTRIDVAAMAALADEGVNVVLVGFAPSPAVVALVDAHPRVHWLGARPPHASAPYLLHSDVGIVAHTDEAFTATMEPHKLYNYACAGLPSVALHCVCPPVLAGMVEATDAIDDFVKGVLRAAEAGRLDAVQVDRARQLTWGRVARLILEVAER